MEINERAINFYVGVIVGIVGNLFASYLIEALNAQFENKPFGIFSYWVFGLIATSFIFFQLTKFVMKRFGTPKKVLLFLDIASIVIPIVGILWIINKSGTVIVDLNDFLNWVKGMGGGEAVGLITGAGILGFIIGFCSEFFLKVLFTHYSEWREGVKNKRLLRGDLRARIRTICDVWKHRDYHIPVTPFRDSLVEKVIDIQESLNDEFAELEKDEKDNLFEVTNEVLALSARCKTANDSDWSKEVEEEMDEVCKKLKELVKDLD